MPRTRMWSLRPGRSGTQDTEAAHDQVDLGTGLQSAKQGCSTFLIEQGVQLRDDSRRGGLAGVLGFAVNKGNRSFRRGDRATRVLLASE